MALTAITIRAAKPSQEPYELADGGRLYLLINPSGSRLWRWKYRFQGRVKLLAFGAYPETRLSQAHSTRDTARRHRSPARHRDRARYLRRLLVPPSRHCPRMARATGTELDRTPR